MTQSHLSSTAAAWARFRFSVVGSLLSSPRAHGALETAIAGLADKTWSHPVTGRDVQFSAVTIERWYYTALRRFDDPVAAFRRAVRKDCGKVSLATAVAQQLQLQYRQYPHWSYQLHYDNLAAWVKADPSSGRLRRYPSIRLADPERSIDQVKSKGTEEYTLNHRGRVQPHGSELETSPITFRIGPLAFVERPGSQSSVTDEPVVTFLIPANMNIFHEGLFLGKVALITGGGTGIGRGIAEALARHGADVVIVSRKPENLEMAADQIVQSTGRRCLAIAGDVRQPQAVESAVARTVQELGGLDMVVNNAAGNFFCPSADLSPNGFGTVIDIDAKGTWNVSRAAYQARFKDNGGQILNISATLHYGGTPGQVHVAAAKAAVDAMTRTLAVEWGPHGIRVNAIAPGPILDTEGARRLFPGTAAEALRAMTPTRRLGTIEDIVNLALFVLSDAGVHLNGAILVSDGGLCLAGRTDVGLVPASRTV